MNLSYFITDPQGQIHEAKSVEEYENIIAKLREQHGVECELSIRAEVKNGEQDTNSMVA